MGSTLALLAALILVAAAARAETLREALTDHGVGPPPVGLAALARPLPTSRVLDDAADVLVVWPPDPGGDGSLRAVRFARAAGRWSTRPIAWTDRAATGGLAPPSTACRSGPALRDLVAAVLAAPAEPGGDPRRPRRALDARWAEPATWRDLGRAVAVPDETTEVVYVYAGLRRPATRQCRELRRADFEARFGPGLSERAVQPAVRRALFRADAN